VSKAVAQFGKYHPQPLATRKGVAVGTVIAGRPPAQIRTRGITAYGSYRGCMASKLGAPRLIPGTRVSRSVSDACEMGQSSPWFAPFPPPPPPRLAALCSAASSVLRRYATPPRRACPACGYRLPGPVPIDSGSPRRSPGSRACSFSACLGSTTTRDHPPARDIVGACVAFPLR